MTKVICWQRNLNPAFFLSENAEYDEEINEKEKEGGKIKKWTEATQPWLLRSQQDLTWADTWPSSSRHMVFPPDASSSKISWWWNRPPSAFQHPSTNKNLKQLQKLQNWTNDALGLGKPTSSKTDEFLEKFQTAFDPPPPSFSESYIAIFLNWLRSLQSCRNLIFLKSFGYESINKKLWHFLSAHSAHSAPYHWLQSH